MQLLGFLDVFFVFRSSQEHHRQIMKPLRFTDLLQHVGAVHFRHLVIEQHEVGPLFLQIFQGLPAGIDRRHRIVLFEPARYQREEVLVVVHQEQRVPPVGDVLDIPVAEQTKYAA